MSSKLANLVRETTTGTGTGNLTLATGGGAFVTFAAAFQSGATALQFDYTIQDLVNGAYEIGVGHMSDAVTLVRDSVSQSSNGNALVNFGSGSKNVFCSPPQSLLAPLESLRRNSDPVWAPVFYRGRGINGTAGNATITWTTGVPGVTTQTIGWAPANIDVFATKIAFANWDMSTTGEAYRPAGEVFTLSAGLNYQLQNSTLPAYTFNGAASAVLGAPQSPAPRNFLISDPLPFPIAANNAFAIRVSAFLPGASITYAMADEQAVAGGSVNARIVNGAATPGGVTPITGFTEFDNRVATGWTNQAYSSGVLGASGGGYSLNPSLVLGLMAPPAASVLAFGDSITAGADNFTPDALFNVGYFDQGMTNQIPWANFSRGNILASQFNTIQLAQGVLSLSLATGAYFTDVLVSLGRNDCVSGHSAATIQADVAAVALTFQRQNLPVHVVTILPKSASQDGWTTIANQYYVVAAPTNIGTINIGDTSFTVSSASGITNGMLVSPSNGLGIPPGTTVAISGTTVTFVGGTPTASIPSGTIMNFGNSTPTTYATTALAYNAALLAGYNVPSYNGNGFVYQSVLDMAGVLGYTTSGNFLWNVGLGATALTDDGIHPTQAGGTALNNAGIPGLTRWGKA